jgi:hypothetical protein
LFWIKPAEKKAPGISPQGMFLTGQDVNPDIADQVR